MSTGVSALHPYRWFLRIWPLAVIFHLAGNDYYLVNLTTIGIAQLPFLFAAVVMLVRPSLLTAAVLAGSHLLVIYLKMPLVGNHEILLLLANVTVLLGLLIRRDRWLSAAVPPMRWIVLIGYSAIAFSKLNSGFVDRTVSCAAIFGDEFGERVGVSVSGSPVLSDLAITATILFEVAIPVLLMTRRWRHIGVRLGLVFHTVLALEPVGHVFDFTSVLFMLFLLFLGAEESEAFSAALDRTWETLGTRRIGLVLGVIVLGNYVARGVVLFGWRLPTWLFDYPIWLLYAAFILRTVFTGGAERTSPHPALEFRFAPIMGLVVGLTVLNALSPYLEIRSAGAFNMYSNLVAHDGETNHFLLPGTLPLRDAPVLYEAQPVAEDGSPLDFYHENGLLIPEPNLAQWAALSESRDAPVALAFSDGAQTISSQDVAATGNPADSFWERLFYVRAVDLSEPPSCRRTYGPAH